MQPRVLVFLTLAAPAAVLAGCDNSRIVDTSAEGSGRAAVAARPSPNASATNIATLIKLPSLSGRIAEALAVNNAGTVVAGYSSERRGTTLAVKWTLQADGSWVISARDGRDAPDEIYVMNADGTDERRLTVTDAGNNLIPDWSPDGRQIAFSSDRTGVSQVYVMNADGPARGVLQDAGQLSDAYFRGLRSGG